MEKVKYGYIKGYGKGAYGAIYSKDQEDKSFKPIRIQVTTGGLTKIGKRFDFHIHDKKDVNRVSNKLKKLVKMYPDKWTVMELVKGLKLTFQECQVV